MPRPRSEWDFYSGEYWDKRFGKKGPWSDMPGTDISGAEFEAVSSEVNPGDGLIGMTEAEAAESEDWECPECQYDREESGDQPKPEYCPLCLSDSGHLVRIRYKK